MNVPTPPVLLERPDVTVFRVLRHGQDVPRLFAFAVTGEGALSEFLGPALRAGTV